MSEEGEQEVSCQLKQIRRFCSGDAGAAARSSAGQVLTHHQLHLDSVERSDLMARESDGSTAGGVVAASDEKKVDEQVSQQDRLPESLGGLSGQEDEDAMGEGSLSLIYGVRGREREE